MTGFGELDELLADFATGVQSVLGQNFVGAYLSGSFATGDADVYSDVDFLVVTDRTPSTGEQVGLQALHELLFTRETHWAQHLEGSYAPQEELRRPGAEQWFYFDNGSTTPEWDAHCNTAVLRWTLRECAVTLAGPDPRDLVEPISGDALRAEARARAAEFGAWAHEPQDRFASGMSRWKQPHLVLMLCRALHTLETGAVGSKREAGEWAKQTLDPAWSELIARALADRPDPWARVHQESGPQLVTQTEAFADYAMTLVSRPSFI